MINFSKTKPSLVRMPLTFIVLSISTFLSACNYFESEQAKLQKAKTLYDQNEFNESIFRAKKILQSNPKNCEARILLGQDQFAKFSLIDAQDSFQKAKSQGCKSLQLFYYSVKTLLYKNKLEEAKALFSDPHFDYAVNEPESIRLEGELYFLQKNHKKAEELYARYNNVMHDDAANCLSQIKLAAMENNYEGVIQKSAGCEKIYADKKSFDINQSRYLRAIAQVYMKQDKAAEATLNSILKTYSNYKDPNIKIQSSFLLMKLYIARKDIDHASKMADDLLKYIASPDIYYAKGLKAVRDKRYDIAEQQFLMALKLNPKYEASLLALADLMYKEGNIEQAKYYAGKADSVTGKNIFTERLDEMLAIKYLQQGDLDSIIDKIPRDKSGGTIRSQYILALAYAKKGDSINTWKVFHVVEQKLADMEKAEFLKARLYIALGDTKNAEEIYKKYVNSGNAYAALGLSQLYIQLRKYENAESLLADLVHKPASKYSATLLLVELYSITNQKDKIIGLLKQNIDNGTNKAIYQILLAKVYFKNAMYQEAINTCETILKSDPVNIDGYAIKANSYIKLGKIDDAKVVFNEIIVKDPQNTYAYFMLAYLANKESKYDSAVAYLNKALEINPQYLNAIYAKIELLLDTKRTSDALEFAKTTANTFKKKQTADLLLGFVYEKIGDNKNAYLNYLDALQNGNQDIRIAIQTYKLSVSVNGKDKAVKEFERFLEEGTTRESLIDAANYFMSQHENDLAEKCYQVYITKNQDNPTAYNNLAWLKLVKGDYDNANTYASKALSLAPESPAIMDTMGLVLLRSGAYDKAEPYLVAAHQKLNGDPTVTYHLALNYFRKKNYAKSKALLLKIVNMQFPEQQDVKKLLEEIKNNS